MGKRTEPLHAAAGLAVDSEGAAARPPRADDATLDDALTSRIERLGPCQLLRRIGTGGTSTVFLARLVDERPHAPIGTLVVVKVLHPGLADDPRARARFAQEGRIAGSLDHPAIARVHETGRDHVGGSAVDWQVQEHVPGRSLRQVLDEDGAFDVPSARRLGARIARALAAVHAAGVVHRDLKPSNVLVSGDGEIKLIDFGVAHLLDAAGVLTRSGDFVGTLAYAAPEQLAGREVGPACDLHALGLILRESITGARPGATGPGASERPTRSGGRAVVDPFLDDVIAVLLASDPRDRFATAAEVAEVLEQGEASAWWRDRRRIRHSRRRAVAVAAVGLAIALGVLGLLARGAHEASPRALAQARVAAAREHLRSGRLVAAMDLLKVRGEGRPEDALPLALRAEVAHELGRQSIATAEATRALSLARGLDEQERLDVEAHAQLALDRPEVAEGMLRALVLRRPANVDDRLSLLAAIAGRSDGARARPVAEGLHELVAPDDDPRIDLLLAWATGSNDAARWSELAHRSAASARERGLDLLEAQALVAAGWAHVHLDELDAAEAAFEAARPGHAAAGDTYRAAWCTMGLGVVAFRRGELELAVERDLEALRAFEALAHAVRIRSLRGNLAEALLAADRLAEAWIHLEAVEAMGGGGALRLLKARLDLEEGAVAAAERDAETALRISFSYPPAHVPALVFAGALARRQGRLEDATALLHEGVTLARAFGQRSNEAEGLHELALVHGTSGDLDEATRILADVVAVREQLGECGAAADSALELARLENRNGRPSSATTLALGAAGWLESQSQGPAAARARLVAASAQARDGQCEAARAQWRFAQVLASGQQGEPDELAMGIDEARAAALVERGAAADRVTRLEALAARADAMGLPTLGDEARRALEEVRRVAEGGGSPCPG